jgi:hypothetical protein
MSDPASRLDAGVGGAAGNCAWARTTTARAFFVVGAV